jgi:hypothetical protein
MLSLLSCPSTTYLAWQLCCWESYSMVARLWRCQNSSPNLSSNCLISIRYCYLKYINCMFQSTTQGSPQFAVGKSSIWFVFLSGKLMTQVGYIETYDGSWWLNRQHAVRWVADSIKYGTGCSNVVRGKRRDVIRGEFAVDILAMTNLNITWNIWDRILRLTWSS